MLVDPLFVLCRVVTVPSITLAVVIAVKVLNPFVRPDILVRVLCALFPRSLYAVLSFMRDRTAVLARAGAVTFRGGCERCRPVIPLRELFRAVIRRIRLPLVVQRRPPCIDIPRRFRNVLYPFVSTLGFELQAARTWDVRVDGPALFIEFSGRRTGFTSRLEILLSPPFLARQLAVH